MSSAVDRTSATTSSETGSPIGGTVTTPTRSRCGDGPST